MSANLSQRRGSSLYCAQCRAELGLEDTLAGGLRLFKWSVCLQRIQSTAWEKFPVQEFVCAQLLALVDAQAIRKYLAYSGALGDTKSALLVSVSFTENILTRSRNLLILLSYGYLLQTCIIPVRSCQENQRER